MRVAAALAALAAVADAATLRYGFSDCVDNTRTLFYYSDDGGTCSAATEGQELARPPVRGLRCDVACDRGFFLGANFSGDVPVSGCERCPTGKYSLGGGKLFSQRTGAWSSPLPIEIHTDCVTQDMYSGEWVSNCNAWSASPDGAYVSSGENSGVLENYEATRLFSTLRVSATLVRDGSITYQYRVDAEDPYDGLIFQIDDNAATAVISQSDGWKEESYTVPAGAHTFSWDYVKDYAGDKGEDKAFIKVIEIVGTSYSDLHCHTCGGDMTMTGGSLCAFCDANQYAAAKSDSELDFTCYPCPENTYAPKGSIGLESCVQQRPCSEDDLVSKYSPCINGKRDVTYSWSDPMTCDTTLQGSIGLPAPKTNVDCSTCAPGYQLMDDNTCEVCPAGQKNADGGDDGCSSCPAGQVVVNALAYGNGMPDAWSSWPDIVDVTSAKASGWKLTQKGIVFSAPRASSATSSTYRSRYPLAFNVTFERSGQFNLTYQLTDVPTFGGEGDRAWLELEMKDVGAQSNKVAMKPPVGTATDASASTEDGDDADDADEDIVHLLHGGENGTFSEVIAVNVTGTTTKQFQLVLRTTSQAAAQFIQAKISYMGFVGTADGGGVGCGSCPSGYEAVSSGVVADTDIDDDSETTSVYGCQICAAGTYVKVVNGVPTCTKCPANTYSGIGSSECTPCGANTYSGVGALSCAAPQSLTLNATTTSTSSSSTSTSVIEGLQLTYNISLLESLVWGNESWIFEDTVYGNSTSLLSTEPVYGTEAFEMDKQNFIFAGLFRPVADDWKDIISGQIVERAVETDANHLPYIVLVTMLNPRQAGNYFFQKSARYGEVMCSAPSQWRVSSAGSHMEIQPRDNGAGVKVLYTGGSPCSTGDLASTTIDFECDLNSGTTTRPLTSALDDDKCHWSVVWKTAYACPVCNDDYFDELRSACSGGEQAVSYAKKLACYGGSSLSDAQSVSTCTEQAVVLDTKALYSVYAAICVVGFVVLLLMMGILIIHRKYRNAYNDYLYLKGKMPVDVKTKEDGSKETTFEFSSDSSPLHSSPLGTTPSPINSSSVAFEEKKRDDEEDAEHGIVHSV